MLQTLPPGSREAPGLQNYCCARRRTAATSPPPGRDPAAHRTEEAAFFAGPGAWLERAFPRRLLGALPPRTLPSHLVMFDPLEAEVRPFLRRHGYRRTWQAFHSHFAVDRGLQARVLVYTRGGGGGGGGGR